MANFQVLSIVAFVCICFCLSSGQDKFDEALVWSLWPAALESGAKIRTIPVMVGYDTTANIRAPGIRFFTTEINFISVDVDYRERTLFLYDTFHHAIAVGYNMSSRLDVSEMSFHFFYRGVGGSKTQLAIDYVSHTLYWTDPTFKIILAAPSLPEKSDFDYYKTIVQEDLYSPAGIAVDPNGTLFFSDIGDNPKIERTDLDGTNRKRLITNGLVYPHSLDWDHWDQRLYWIDTDLSTVYWTKADGTGTTFVRRFHGADLFDIAVFKNVLYTTDIDQDRDGMYTINKTTTLAAHYKITIRDEMVEALALFNIEAQPMPDKDYCKELNCSHLCVGKNKGAICVCSDGFKLADDSRSCVEDTGTSHKAIVIATKNSICLASVRLFSDLNFQPVCVLYTPESIPTTTTAAPTRPSPTTQAPSVTSSTTRGPQVTANIRGEIKYLDIDMEDRVIYFMTNVSLYRIPVPIKLDPSNSVTEEHLLELSGTPSGLVHDWIDDNLYWTQLDSGSIFMYSQEEGIAREVITGQVQPRSLTLLAHQRQLIWIAGRDGSYTIKAISIQGTFGTPMDLVPSSKLKDPVALIKDTATPRLLWFERSTKTIMSANLDGSQITSVISANQSTYILVSYKNFLTMIYANATGSSIDVYNRDISNKTITGVSYDHVSDVKVLDVTLQPPGPHACNDLIHNCDQICFTVDSTHTGQTVRQCRCQEGYTLINDTKCITKPIADKFLLVGDSALGEIFQISKNGQNLQAVQRPSDGLPTGIVYDRVKDRVIYGVEDSTFIYTTSLKGELYTNLGEIVDPESFPYRFALDNTTGNLYYTTRGRKSMIGVVANSWKSKRHLKLYENEDDSWILSDIVVHPEKGYMFWAEYNGTEARIRRAMLDGKRVTTIIDSTTSIDVIRWPEGLAIDYIRDMLYFADEYYDTISRCNYDGSNIANLTFDLNAYIVDIVMDDTYVYYTATNKMHITKMSIQNSADVSIVYDNHRLGRLEAVDFYCSTSTNIQPVSPDCQPNNGLGDCGSICFPTEDGRKCACFAHEYLLENNTCSEEFFCDTVTLHNSAMLSPSCQSRLDETCKITCQEGFDTIISETKCTLKGWDVKGRQQCKAITCSRKVPKVYIFDNCTSTSYRDTCGYGCPHGYKPRTPAAVCQADGQWAAACDPIYCSKSIDHVTFDAKCGFRIGELCSFTCEAGYKTKSAQVACLSDGTWSDSLCEEVTCEKTPKAHVTFDTSCSFTPHSPCGYSCAEGYRKTVTTVSCSVTGAWPSDLCTAITCPRNISGGVWENDCTFRYGAECQVSCNQGTIEPVKCLVNGSWSNTDPCGVVVVPNTMYRTQAKTPESKGGIIGGVIAAVVAVCVVVAVVWFVFRRRRHQKLEEEKEPKAVYRGRDGPNIAIENPGYMVQGALEQPHQLHQQPSITMAHVTLEAVPTPSNAQGPERTQRSTMREERAIEIPDQDFHPEVDADDVVLTKDSWQKEKTKHYKSAPDA